MIRCVMFDFGNVLMLFDSQRWYDFIQSRQRFGSPSSYQFFNFEFVAQYDLGQIDEFDFFELTKRTFRLDVELEEFFFEFTANMRPDLRMLALKQILKQNNIKLAVVSNINRYHFEYVRQKWPGVFMDFDYLALSFRLGIRKPDARIWQTAAKRLKVRPEECFFIDDLEVNINAFECWRGVGQHYNVIDEKYCPNGRLGIERNKLIMRMESLGMLSHSQLGNLTKRSF